MNIERIHHVACRCKEAKEAVLWKPKRLDRDMLDYRLRPRSVPRYAFLHEREFKQ